MSCWRTPRGEDGLAAAVALFWLRNQHRVLDTVAIGLLTAAAVFLLRKSANMPQLNEDGLSGFSANDYGTYVALRPELAQVQSATVATVSTTGAR